MRLLRKASENEMIAAFLIAEIDSPRFGPRVHKVLKANKIKVAIIRKPNLRIRQENTLRRKVLKLYRGYPKTLLFEGYVRPFKWFLVSVDYLELSKFKFINHHEWFDLTKGTRRVGDVKLDARLKVALKKIRKAKKIPPIISLATSLNSKKKVIIEGSTRAACRVRSAHKGEIEMLLGVAQGLHRMKYWR